MNFGKDLGVVHEAVVTGRKAAAGQKFWASLAHSETAFAVIKPLAVHVGIIEKYEIDPCVRIVNRAVELGAWLNYTFSGKDYCLTCDKPKPEMVGAQPWDKTDEEPDWQYYCDLRKKFFEELCDKLVEMNIHPVELNSTLPEWREDNSEYFVLLRDCTHKSEKYCVGIDRNDCISADQFLKAFSNTSGLLLFSQVYYNI